MKRLIAIPVFFGLGIVCLTYVFANEDENTPLRTVFENWCAAYEAGEKDTVIHHIDVESKAFIHDGGILVAFQSTVADHVGNIKILRDAGGTFQISLKNLNVKVYGNTGIVTTYMLVTTTSPDGNTDKEPPIRHSSTWAKTSGEWKVIHLHHSPLTGDLPVDDKLGDL